MPVISTTPKPPYYAVIFTSEHSADEEGYAEMAAHMKNLAHKQEGFLGIESVSTDREGITVSYWSSLEAIRSWKGNVEHRAAQVQGRERWYENFRVRVAKVERDY